MEGLHFHSSTNQIYVLLFLKKISGCSTGLNSSHAIAMFASPCPVLLKISGILQGKDPSSGLRFKHENVAFANTTYTIKILWIAL